MTQNRPKMTSVQPPNKKQQAVEIFKKFAFSLKFYLQNKKVQRLILTLLKNTGKDFLLLKTSNKLVIICEITGCQSCYFVSSKFYIGHSY